MKRIVLATPPLSMKERYGVFASAGNTMPSLGLLSLASVLRKKGFEVSIVEASSLSLGYERTIKRILSLNPDCLGLTATTLSIFSAAQLAVSIKRANWKIKVILGGPHLTALPEETLRMFRGFDFGVIGEGEETLVELLQALENESNLKEVKGIVYRENGEIRVNERRPFLENLDVLPFPAWDLLDGFPGSYHPPAFRFRRLPAASLITSRGCPNHCIFCDRSVFGNRWRAFSSGYILEMVKFLSKQYGIRELLLEDDTFFLSLERVKEFCEGLLKADLQISWSCLGRVNLLDREVFKLMKKAGCWQIGFGIESGDQGILDFAKKKITLEQVREAVALARDIGIETKGFFILGFPGEDKITLKRTVDFARELPLNDVSVSFLTPFPGSRLYQEASRYGIFENDWRKMNLLTVVFLPAGLTEQDLLSSSRELWKKFYLRPRIILNYLLRLLRNPALTLNLFKGFFAFWMMLIKRKKT